MPIFLTNSNVFVLGQWRRLQWESREPLCWFWKHCDTWKKRGRLHQQCHVFYLLGWSRRLQLLPLCFVFLTFCLPVSQGWSSFTVGASKFASIAKDNVSVWKAFQTMFLRLIQDHRQQFQPQLSGAAWMCCCSSSACQGVYTDGAWRHPGWTSRRRLQNQHVATVISVMI